MSKQAARKSMSHGERRFVCYCRHLSRRHHLGPEDVLEERYRRNPDVLLLFHDWAEGHSRQRSRQQISLGPQLQEEYHRRSLGEGLQIEPNHGIETDHDELNVPPRSRVIFYQKEYKFRKSMLFILDPWEGDVGSWRAMRSGGRNARWRSTAKINRRVR